MQTELLRTVEKSQHSFEGLTGIDKRYSLVICNHGFQAPVGGGGLSRVLDFSLYPQCRGNDRGLSHIGKHGSHI